jgi:hypothetical protein
VVVEHDALSLDVLFINAGDVAPLKRAAYLSSQGVPFECLTCDYYRKRGEWYGDCVQPSIKRKVEAWGCCNLWQRNGVHG